MSRRKKTRRKRKRIPPAGARPGTLVPATDRTSPTRLRVVRYDSDRLEVQDDAAHDAPELCPSEDGVTWVDVEGLGDAAVLQALGDRFAIHPLALEDVVNVPVLPKAETYEGHVLMVGQLSGFADGEVICEQVGILFGSGWLLTFREGKLPDPFSMVCQRLTNPTGFARRSGADYLAYALFDIVVDSALPAAEALAERLEEIEDRLLAEPRKRVVRELHDVKQQLLALRRWAPAHRDAVQLIQRDEDDRFTEPVRVFLRDVYDHAAHIVDSIEASREMVANLLNLYLSLQGQHTNDVMRVLTIVASLFVPLTFIAGVYGMNFKYMPETQKWWGYPAVITLMIAVAAGLLIYFARKGWLSSDDEPWDEL